MKPRGTWTWKTGAWTREKQENIKEENQICIWLYSQSLLASKHRVRIHFLMRSFCVICYTEPFASTSWSLTQLTHLFSDLLPVLKTQYRVLKSLDARGFHKMPVEPRRDMLIYHVIDSTRTSLFMLHCMYGWPDTCVRLLSYWATEL